MSEAAAISAWAEFWVAALAVAVCLFALLSVYVIVAGARDIRRMFAELRRQADA